MLTEMASCVPGLKLSLWGHAEVFSAGFSDNPVTIVVKNAIRWELKLESIVTLSLEVVFPQLSTSHLPFIQLELALANNIVEQNQMRPTLFILAMILSAAGTAMVISVLVLVLSYCFGRIAVAFPILIRDQSVFMQASVVIFIAILAGVVTIAVIGAAVLLCSMCISYFRTAQQVVFDQNKALFIVDGEAFRLVDLISIENFNSHGRHGGTSRWNREYTLTFRDGSKVYVSWAAPQSIAACQKIEEIHSLSLAEATYAKVVAGASANFGPVIVHRDRIDFKNTGQEVVPDSVKIVNNALIIQGAAGEIGRISMNRVINCRALLRYFTMIGIFLEEEQRHG